MPTGFSYDGLGPSWNTTVLAFRDKLMKRYPNLSKEEATRIAEKKAHR